MMNLPEVAKDVARQLEEVCQNNVWLKRGGIFFQENIGAEEDYNYHFCQASTMKQLRAFFVHGNWAIRNGIVYKDLAFINQVNGGDEWWGLKLFEGVWYAFDSITFSYIIADEEFSQFMKKLDRLTVDDMPTAEISIGGWWNDDEPPFDPSEIEPDEPDKAALVASERVGEMLWKDEFADFVVFVNEATNRFAVGDWGDLCDEDKRTNTKSNNFKLAEYIIPEAINANGEKKLWVIFDGFVTTILFPSEY